MVPFEILMQILLALHIERILQFFAVFASLASFWKYDQPLSDSHWSLSDLSLDLGVHFDLYTQAR